MAKLKLQSNASGTGVVTLTAPNTNTDRTITLPDVTGGILTSASTLDATKLSGALPILDGSSLTGVGPTKSASNPAIDTNGALGDQWINTTIGEMFVCTDATAGSNVWKGQDGSNVAPIGVSTFDYFQDNSAIALYQLNDNVNDTGGSYNATITGGGYSTGKFGNCYDSSSAAGYIDTGMNSAVTTTIKTYSLWFSCTGNAPFIGNHEGTQQSDDIRLSMENGKVRFALIQDNGNTSTDYVQGAANVANDGNWHHVVLTLAGMSSGSAFKLYVDNVQIGSGT